MGVWGPGLYANDTAEDARMDFNDVFSVKPAAEATKIIVDEYLKDIADDDWEELADFWYAFADWQWNKGILQPEVKQAALNLLNRGAGVELWLEEGRQSDIKKRMEVLENLRRKLDSPMPQKKKIKNSNIHFRLEEGDVIAVRPNEKFKGITDKNSKDSSFFTADNIKAELKYHYGKVISEKEKMLHESLGDYQNFLTDKEKQKKCRLSFDYGYRPILNRESYFLLLCVRKERYYNKKWNIPELYDEALQFIYYDYYSSKLPQTEKDISSLSFFRIIDEQTFEQKFMTTDWFSGFTLEKYKKICHSTNELGKFTNIEAQCQWNASVPPSIFLLSYELLKNPLIQYKIIN